MNISKKLFIVNIIILFINLTYFSTINANINKEFFDINPVVVNSNISRPNYENVTIHRFCHIESGNVEHRNLNGAFFCIPIVIGSEIRHFVTGSFSIHLKGGGVRLTVSKIFRMATYKEDVIVSVRGFIGMVQPTGGLSDGFLSGYSLITSVVPLENQQKKIDYFSIESSKSSSFSISSAIFASFTN